jgi:hypothetical protein
MFKRSVYRAPSNNRIPNRRDTSNGLIWEASTPVAKPAAQGRQQNTENKMFILELPKLKGREYCFP